MITSHAVGPRESWGEEDKCRRERKDGVVVVGGEVLRDGIGRKTRELYVTTRESYGTTFPYCPRLTSSLGRVRVLDCTRTFKRRELTTGGILRTGHVTR